MSIVHQGREAHLVLLSALIVVLDSIVLWVVAASCARKVSISPTLVRHYVLNAQQEPHHLHLVHHHAHPAKVIHTANKDHLHVNYAQVVRS